MATQQRTAEQAEARGQEIRTLVIAALASGLAAVIVSQFWFAGTWIAAALTPIVVTLVREAIERPTSKIAERVTSDRAAVQPLDRGAVQPRVVMPPDEEPRVERGSGDRRMDQPAPVRVYGKKQPSGKRKLAVRAAIVTGLLGFVIAFGAITITDLVAGKSVTGSGKRLTFGSGKKDNDKDQQPADTQDEDQEQQTQPSDEQDTQQQTQPQDTQQTTPQQQQQTTPQQTTPTTPTTPQKPPGG